MAGEEELRGYSTVAGANYKVLQERNQAGMSHDNFSGTADGPSDEKSSGSPRLVIASSPENFESGSADLQPPISSNVDEAMPSTSGGNVEVSSVTDEKIPDANSNAEINAANEKDGDTAVRCDRTHTAGNKAVLPLSMSSSIVCDDAVPSTSRAGLGAAAAAGNNAREAATERENRRGISAVYDDVNRVKETSGERPHKCEICGNSFKIKTNLKRHRLIHTGDKPFHCSQCPRSFTRKVNFVIHCRIHAGEKPFKCTTCTKSFRDPGTLREHERRHTGERPYKCEMCDHSSKTSVDLRRHRRTHKNKKTAVGQQKRT